MDWSTTSPLGAIKQRMDWLGQRQQVLARNIANADTPGYVPSDLQPLRFRDALRREASPVSLAATDTAHLPGIRRPQVAFTEQRQRDIAEVTPTGNAVDLEEQMAKVNETTASHKLATQLYRKYLSMIRMAASARG